jgi:hypothetical protein
MACAPPARWSIRMRVDMPQMWMALPPPSSSFAVQDQRRQ